MPLTKARDRIRLGVNIDHVATVRNARGGVLPDPVRAAKLALKAGADSITAHLREDRRHITDSDIARLSRLPGCALNMEMAPTQEMLEIALRYRPYAACLVPERRQELTTEGGLDVVGNRDQIVPVVVGLAEAGVRVSLFIDPDFKQLDAARDIGAPAVELHTGTYCDLDFGLAREKAYKKLKLAAEHAQNIGLSCHAGHGISYDTVRPVASIPQVSELNIGHFLVGEAIFCGLEEAVRRMRGMMDDARGLGVPAFVGGGS